MLIQSSPSEIRAAIAELHGNDKRVAFVPTMGNLHAGHLALVEAAAEKADAVVVSIFVNPLQFGPGEDFDSYPRTLQADCAQLETIGVDIVFTPTVDDMYPAGGENATVVSVPGISRDLCGASRAGHFDGVTTVVARLFNLVPADVAVFGEKDFQQLHIIRRMAQDLAFDIDIVGIPTVRELDGLAMSSRNQYLDTEQRALAPLLYQVLNDMAGAIANGDHNFAALEQAGMKRLAAVGFEPEYLEVRREHDLARPLAGSPSGSFRVLAAARLGKARLIDNLGVPG